MGRPNINIGVGGATGTPQSTYKTVILKSNIPFASQVNEPNCKYVIKWDFTLTENTTIPENCILEFDGGSINGNNTLSFNDCLLQGNVLITSLLSGNVKNSVLYATWFGIKGDGTDEKDKVLKLLDTNKGHDVVFDFENLEVYTTTTITCPNRIRTTTIRNLVFCPSINTFNSEVTDKPVFYVNGIAAKIILDNVTFSLRDTDYYTKHYADNNGITAVKIGASCRTYILNRVYCEYFGTFLKVLSAYYSEFTSCRAYICYKGIDWVPYEVSTNNWAGASVFRDTTISGCYIGCNLKGYISSLHFDSCYFEACAYKLITDGEKCSAYFENCYFADGGLTPITVNNGNILISKSKNKLEGVSNSISGSWNQVGDVNKIAVVNGGKLTIEDVTIGDARNTKGGSDNRKCLPISVLGGACELRNVCNTELNPTDYEVQSGAKLVIPKIKNYIKIGTNLAGNISDIDPVHGSYTFTISPASTKNRYGNYGIVVSASNDNWKGIHIPYSVDNIGAKALIVGVKATTETNSEQRNYIADYNNQYSFYKEYDSYKASYQISASTTSGNSVGRLYPTSSPYTGYLNILVHLLNIKQKDGYIVIGGSSEFQLEFIALVDIEYANTVVDFADDENKKGTVRPTIGMNIGDTFFDTSLSPARLIVWNGTDWVNADGTSLS